MRLEKRNEQEVLRFAEELLSLYFEKRDMSTLADYIADCTSWIDTGDGDCFTVVNTDFHFSHADMEQEPGHYFVKKAARTDNESLRAELNIRER